MKIHEIKYVESENKINELINIRVEMKGVGPTIQVLGKTKIIVTNKRLIIGQKILFSSKYLIRYIVWFDSAMKQKFKFGAGSMETSIAPADITQIEKKEKQITCIKPGGAIDYLHIFASISDLSMD